MAKNQNMKFIYWILFAILIVSAINWGLVGLFGENTNLVRLVSFNNVDIERGIYIVIGAAGVAAAILALSMGNK